MKYIITNKPNNMNNDNFYKTTRDINEANTFDDFEEADKVRIGSPQRFLFQVKILLEDGSIEEISV